MTEQTRTLFGVQQREQLAIKPALSPAMQAIITEAYQQFATIWPHAELEAAIEGISAKTLQHFIHTPLAQLSLEALTEYKQCVKPNPHSIAEGLYLLPRILELIASHQFPYHSPELCLQNLSSLPFGAWSDSQRQIVMDFALQFMRDLLQSPSSAHKLYLGDALVMFYKAGLALDPLLAVLLQENSFYAVSLIAHLLVKERSNEQLTNRFVNDWEIDTIFNVWFCAPATQASLKQQVKQALAQIPCAQFALGEACPLAEAEQNLYFLDYMLNMESS